MRVIVTKDYPEELSETIERWLKTDYTVTGYYGDKGLEWIIEYRGSRDTAILDTATVDTVYEYRIRNAKGVW